jgi:hypothetical protein
MVGAIIAAVIGGIVAVVGGIWILITAFHESTSQGLLCMFVPFYVVYYAIKRWSDAKKPFVLCLVGFVLVLGGLVPTLMQFKSEVEPVVTKFMEACEDKDVEAAYACFSTQSVTKEDLTDLINNNYSIFADFEHVTTSSWEVESGAGITQGYVTGAIIYSEDIRLPFEAWLVKENDIWKLTGIYIGY